MSAKQQRHVAGLEDMLDVARQGIIAGSMDKDEAKALLEKLQAKQVELESDLKGAESQLEKAIEVALQNISTLLPGKIKAVLSQLQMMRRGYPAYKRTDLLLLLEAGEDEDAEVVALLIELKVLHKLRGTRDLCCGSSVNHTPSCPAEVIGQLGMYIAMWEDMQKYRVQPSATHTCNVDVCAKTWHSGAQLISDGVLGLISTAEIQHVAAVVFEVDDSGKWCDCANQDHVRQDWSDITRLASGDYTITLISEDIVAQVEQLVLSIIDPHGTQLRDAITKCQETLNFRDPTKTSFDLSGGDGNGDGNLGGLQRLAGGKRIFPPPAVAGVPGGGGGGGGASPSAKRSRPTAPPATPAAPAPAPAPAAAEATPLEVAAGAAVAAALDTKGKLRAGKRDEHEHRLLGIVGELFVEDEDEFVESAGGAEFWAEFVRLCTRAAAEGGFAAKGRAVAAAFLAALRRNSE